MASQESLVDVGAVEDFPEGRAQIVTAGGRELGIIRWHDRVYAVRNVCAHMGAPLCLGVVSSRVSADSPLGRIAADHDHPVISCPWHGWTFDLDTGGSVFDAQRFRTKSYPVEIEDGRVKVRVGERRGASD